MKLPTRQIPTVLPGVRGTLRAERPTRALLPRLRRGDVAVIDHTDLDRKTAQAMVDAGVVAVVNAQPMVSGRFPNRGPELLAEAGVTLVDNVGEIGLSSLVDGRRVRILDGQIYDGELRLTEGRAVNAQAIKAEMDRARSGLAAQLEAFTHNSSELLRREEEVLLHGAGLPQLATQFADRPVVVVADHPDAAKQLRGLRSFMKEQRPVVVAVGDVGSRLKDVRRLAKVVVVGAEPDALPPAKILRTAGDVVVAPAGRSTDAVVESLEGMGVVPLRFGSSLAPEDAALLLASAQHASLVIGVGMSTTLTDFLESQRPGLAGTYLSRLAVGPRLVDAAAVPALYSGKVTKRHLLLTLLVCMVAIAAAIATTDVGQDWLHHLRDWLAEISA